MSKHLFSATTAEGNPVEVDTGWDRPLQYFYLSVYGPDPADDPNDRFEATVFESMMKPGGGFLQVEQVEAQLQALGITPPAGLYPALQEDKRANRGNSVTRYQGEQATTDSV